MQHADWADAGQGWQGKETTLRLVGWSRQRRIILLRRKLGRDLAITDRTNPAQPLLGFAEVGPDKAAWEYAALITSLDNEILTLGQLYRDRADCENVFDELKNQWGWGGFTTQDLARCRLLAGTVALAYNWWSLFVRLADPEHHREALDQPTSVAVRHRVQNPARRSGEADHQQHPWQCATRLGGPMSVSPASWLSCEKMRSSWTRWKSGIASSAKPSGTFCMDANFSRRCTSARRERLPRAANLRSSLAVDSSTAGSRTKVLQNGGGFERLASCFCATSFRRSSAS